MYIGKRTLKTDKEMIMNVLTEYTRDFKVIAVSANTNSFGLFQMIVIAKNGMAYKTHASKYNVKKENEILTQFYNMTPKGEERGHNFKGCELTERVEDAPSEVIAEVWK